ncbi:MAG: hypothetical protein P1V81_13385 [Planctomycetota bacterium]|nr:hypothetical protein [Planctomycetota bacterium]
MSETQLALALGAVLVAPVLLVVLALELRSPAGPAELPTAAIELHTVEPLEADVVTEPEPEPKIARPPFGPPRAEPAQADGLLPTT